MQDANFKMTNCKTNIQTLSILFLLVSSFALFAQSHVVSTSRLVGEQDASNTDASSEYDNHREEQVSNEAPVPISEANNVKFLEEIGLQTNLCSSNCSSNEISLLLNLMIRDGDILKAFEGFNELVESQRDEATFDKTRSVLAGSNIRIECVEVLVDVIKTLASNELEMRTILEFANDTGSSLGQASIKSKQTNQTVNQDLSEAGRNASTTSYDAQLPKSLVSLDSKQIKWLQTRATRANRTCWTGSDNAATQDFAPTTQDNSGKANPLQPEVTEKSQALAKIIDNIDHWITTVEQFTLTREWDSLMKIFRVTETILDMLVKVTGPQTAKSAHGASRFSSKINVTSSDGSSLSKVQSISPNDTQFIEGLKQSLPGQVLILTSSLNNLFPWHVYPWNNIDLYTTIDTFLNHGIFAFSKTTIGPERRIDLLPQMLETLMKSLKMESFPKKCQDWSKIICDTVSFHDKLVLGSASSDEDTDAKSNRDEKLKELSSDPKNQATQELACIMFSSLSMKRFEAKYQEILKSTSSELQVTDRPAPEPNSNINSILAWDKQVLKALKLYTLSREALTDVQWLTIYNQVRDLWSQQRVSDRIIMVGRVVQILTNCHIPQEMLESALWKDIYKYKNALNQLVDIVIEEMNRFSDNGSLAIDQLALGSKHLHEILEKFLRFLPKLVESLSQTVVDQLPDLVGRFFADKIAFFKVPCKGYSFSDIIPSLSKYRAEVTHIEQLICQQMRTKPNITMTQINNLTNDFLAMAFNLTNIGHALALPKLLGALPEAPAISGVAQVLEAAASATSSESQSARSDDDATGNVTSIIDEMVANPRLSQLVAILQSSTLDPPEVIAGLPELDWVEASTSVALLYESIQKVMSFEGTITIFPELEGFQQALENSVYSSRQMFIKFTKRDPIHLTAYSLDTVMPIALRTFKPMDSFHAECQSSLRDIFSDMDGDPASGKATRQWQCFVSSMNFASWSINEFMTTFNKMFRNIVTTSAISTANRQIETFNVTQQQSKTNSTCVFFDGSIGLMLDNLPQFIDLALETVLIVSTDSNQQMTLYDIMCSSNYMLDPFNERSVELKARMKSKMCHLFHNSSLTDCAQVLTIDTWRAMMKELNSTWFESSAISITPSFREITQNMNEFVELFGQFKLATLSDSLLAKVLDVNSFWTNLLNRIIVIIDKYQEKRFEYALQTLTPIIYDNLPVSSESFDNSTMELRESLIRSISSAKTILNHLDNHGKFTDNSTGLVVYTDVSNSTNQFGAKIQSLFDWADRYSMITVETLLRTIAGNLTKLESMLNPMDQTTSLQNSSPPPKLNMSLVWDRFCLSQADTYFDIQRNVSEVDTNGTSTVLSADYIQLDEGKRELCNFSWRSLYNQTSLDSTKILDEYSERQLIRIALTKWGQVFDVMFIESKNMKQLPKFFYMDYWQMFRDKLPQISPLKDQPSNLIWIWQGFERLVNAMDAGSNKTSNALIKILDQLNCGLEAVKGGLSWENVVNIYQDKQDILAAHTTINNGFSIASIGVNTFLQQKKFQRFLDKFVKPKVGLNAFCELRNRTQLSEIFDIPDGEDFLESLESFQELICDTNFETLAQNINPISVCYKTAGDQQSTADTESLAATMDRFFKLASLATMDAKLVVASDAKPPILDKGQWSNFWKWWQDKTELTKSNTGISLVLVRAFQAIDSVNSDHVVWKALFRSVYEVSEVLGYVLRAIEKKHQESDTAATNTRLLLVKEAASQIDIALRSPAIGSGLVSGAAANESQQQLASTLSNIMFPEVNNFISFRTFKQLRYLRTIAEFYSSTADAQGLVCKDIKQKLEHFNGGRDTNIELLSYQLNTTERLYALMCHYHSSQWLTALNIIVSSKTSSPTKKINYLTKYLSLFTRSYKDNNERLESFMHSQQLTNIENVANTSISYLLATSNSLKTLSFGSISNISWHSLPNLLDSIDRHLCASRYEHGKFHIPTYEPKKLELETVLCKMSQWNITQVYSYLSENFDLQNMISLITQQSGPTSVLTPAAKPENGTVSEAPLPTCVTPFKFASRWLKMGLGIVDEAMSKETYDKIRKCLSASKKGSSVYSQSLRFIKVINSILNPINELTTTNAWPNVRKTWNSITRLILDQNPSFGPIKLQ